MGAARLVGVAHESYDRQRETAASEPFASESEEIGEGPSDDRGVMTGAL